MNVNELALSDINKCKRTTIESGDFTAHLTVNPHGKIHVTLWKEFEQSDGEMNNCIYYIDIYPYTSIGLDEAKKDLSRYIN